MNRGTEPRELITLVFADMVGYGALATEGVEQ